MKVIELNDLDPGVRRLVAFLRKHNFDTCDSGDGVSKPEDERSFGDVAHVVMRVEVDKLVSESHRLYKLMQNVCPDQDWEVGASYNPEDRVPFLFLWRVTDAMLPLGFKP